MLNHFISGLLNVNQNRHLRLVLVAAFNTGDQTLESQKQVRLSAPTNTYKAEITNGTNRLKQSDIRSGELRAEPAIKSRRCGRGAYQHSKIRSLRLHLNLNFFKVHFAVHGRFPQRIIRWPLEKPRWMVASWRWHSQNLVCEIPHSLSSYRWLRYLLQLSNNGGQAND